VQLVPSRGCPTNLPRAAYSLLPPPSRRRPLHLWLDFHSQEAAQDLCEEVSVQDSGDGVLGQGARPSLESGGRRLGRARRAVSQGLASAR
jgi:hypothetical protein